MNRVSYRPELDGLRAICIILTICHHTPGAPSVINGSIGVDVFFALSGWLITALAVQEFLNSGRIDLYAFYIRRFFRIAPLYFVAVAAYGCAAWLMFVLGKGNENLINYYYAFPWLASFNSEYRGDGAGNIFGHAWTLGVEEKFYIIWPVVLFMFLRGNKAVILAIPIICGFLIAAGDVGHILRGYVGLGFGASLALLCRNVRVSEFFSKKLPLYLSFFALILFYTGSMVFPVPVVWNVAVSVASALFVASMWFSKGSKIEYVLSFPPLAFVGKLTFAIYLFHVLVINVVSIFIEKIKLEIPYAFYFSVIYIFSIICGIFMYFLIEKPLIKIGRSISRKENRVRFIGAEN